MFNHINNSEERFCARRKCKINEELSFQGRLQIHAREKGIKYTKAKDIPQRLTSEVSGGLEDYRYYIGNTITLPHQ